MAGGYDAFPLPKYLEDDRKEGFMVPFARAIKQALPGMPVITAGRLQAPVTAEAVLREGSADMVGFRDNLWKHSLGQLHERNLAPGNHCLRRLDLRCRLLRLTKLWQGGLLFG
jgi:hypothetical protein